MDDDRVHLVGVVLVVAVVLGLGGAWAADRYVMNMAGGTNVIAGADVAASPSNATGDPGSVTVTWRPTGDGDGDPPRMDYLVVEWATVDGNTGGTGDLGHAERNVTVTDGTWRLAAVGQSVTLTERTATAVTELRLVVTAVRENTETVVVERTVVL